MATLVALVLLGVAAFAVTAGRGGDGDAAASTSTAVPDGMRAASLHGVQVLVPASYETGPTPCSEPKNSVVVGSFASALCFRAAGAGVTTVRLQPAIAGGDRLGLAVASTDASIGGQPVKSGRGRVAEWSEQVDSSVMYFAGPEVLLSVTGPEQVADKILSSVSVVQKDGNGCDARRATPTLASGSPGSARSIAAGGDLTGGSLCLYRGGAGEGSARLTGRQATDLARSVDGLPVGATRLEPRSTCPDADTRYLVRFERSSGQAEEVWVDFAGCESASVTAGGTVKALNGPFLDRLLTQVPFSGTWSGM